MVGISTGMIGTGPTGKVRPRLCRQILPTDRWGQYRPFHGIAVAGTVAEGRTAVEMIPTFPLRSARTAWRMPAYFEAVYQEAVELTAYLCKEYNLDPLADGVVICHREGYHRGIASNHGDVLHWFPKFGKTMDDFRADVARWMEGEDETVTYEQWKEYMDRYLAERAGATGQYAEAVCRGQQAWPDRWDPTYGICHSWRVPLWLRAAALSEKDVEHERKSKATGIA